MPPSERTELWDRIQSLLGDGYRVERELPGGGMSRLFLATDLALDRKVVVKVLPPELSGDVNAARFTADMGTHFLMRLAEVASVAIARYLPAD